jgi:PTS system mannose-specific IIC component
MIDIKLLALALLGGVLGLDVVSFPQAMISRPVVAATLAGAMFGSGSSGLVAGVALELFALETLPFGASRYPEWGSAAAAGSALYVTQPAANAGSLVAAVLGALLVAWVGGQSMYLLRRLNGALAMRRLEALNRGSTDALTGLQLTGLTADLIRGALLTLLGFVLLRPGVAWLTRHWHLDDRLSYVAVFCVACAVAGSAAWRLFHGTAGARWFFLGGLALGLTAVALT